MKTFAKATSLLLLSTVLCNPASADNKSADPAVGVIRGRVVDADKRTLPGASIYIENLKAIRVSEDTNECVLVFEVALPMSINRNAFRQMLQAKARNVGLSISIQHQDIFEAIHRVPIV